MYLRHSDRGVLVTTRHANHHQFWGATVKNCLLARTIFRYLDLLLLLLLLLLLELLPRVLDHSRRRRSLRPGLQYHKFLTSAGRRCSTPPGAQHYRSTSCWLPWTPCGH